MDRELVLAVLMLITAGPILLWEAHRSRRAVAASDVDALTERACWLALWRPLRSAAVVCVTLLGWALIEPDHAERVPVVLFVLALPFAGIAIRALVRAAWAARPVRVSTAAATGLVSPQVVVSRRYWSALDRSVRGAVKAHERAHVRHRDPLRFWLAQVATDLQWPVLGAESRLMTWRHAVEIARDDEARLQGVDGADLAAGILAALDRDSPRTRCAYPTIVGDAAFLVHRVQRLLNPLPHSPARPSPSTPRVRIMLILLCALGCGAAFGEAVVSACLAFLS